ncbi:MAG: Gfo/Idh/MocA family oxidoreductase [Ferruginibacter sp.]|nr:Gfo/Idh/MocA family oxidoreductase [Ferruginibacter sp.]
MNNINWGIIGCGDVTEIKSGPAFNKVANSKLVAVMRRNADKAADYAKRHNVSKWYSNAAELISDPQVNAIYVATPPSSHELYALAAIAAGKPVYVEKPMSVNYPSAKRIAEEALAKNVKLVVAHYRRQWPLFKKLKQLIDENVIGDVRLVRLVLYKTLFTSEQLINENLAWRVNPAIAGGGIFHDLAPHQLDILYHLFGPAKQINGMALNQSGSYKADDMVTGNILFENGIVFSGAWCFNTYQQTDYCEIIGSKGKLCYSFFDGGGIELFTNNTTTLFAFDTLPHVQQPMIEETVKYFLGTTGNPCSGQDGAVIMQWIDKITNGR